MWFHYCKHVVYRSYGWHLELWKTQICPVLANVIILLSLLLSLPLSPFFSHSSLCRLESGCIMSLQTNNKCKPGRLATLLASRRGGMRREPSGRPISCARTSGSGVCTCHWAWPRHEGGMSSLAGHGLDTVWQHRPHLVVTTRRMLWLSLWPSRLFFPKAL